MKLHMIDMPVEDEELASWLELQLVSLHLPELVSELAACHGINENGPTLSEILGADRSLIWENGLSSVSHESIALLLQNPRRLIDLYDEIVVHGGDCWWNEAALDQTTRESCTRGKLALQARISSPPPEAEVNSSSSSPAKPPAATGSSRRSTMGWWLALAACLALGIAIGRYWPESEIPTKDSAVWGWSDPNLLADAKAPQAYFEHLADGAEAWFDQRPVDAADLSQRLAEFRGGCSRIMLAKHSVVSDKDRQWLYRQCRLWAGEIDDHIVRLEEGDPAAEVRESMDNLVRDMVDELRLRPAKS
ncbi:hypothetical protein LOC68_00980 [Blastopirellula sp. JC732]|uniref:Uncharacterized protein n=1 Tax=Blastopirellula sediminis TaxID=2894196 RepID=A0A9X1SE91_9BACT|nr:hypothetical protein [Blastopirellula sediminis]MCC9608239.1 hypothetical protein [Blastopirellula sediminis]MCC9626968.1 hypothetical protein [Blastopirellula sediminis]